MFGGKGRRLERRGFLDYCIKVMHRQLFVMDHRVFGPSNRVAVVLVLHSLPLLGVKSDVASTTLTAT